MGAPKAPPKDAFEKIRSRVQKREIYQTAVQEAQTFMVKLDDKLHHLTPTAVDDQSVSFTVTGEVPEGSREALGFFHVGPDRYFFNGLLARAADTIAVPLDADVFKLQRRKTLRASVPPDYPVTLTITQIDNRVVFVEAQVLDVSGGGVRIVFPTSEDRKMTGSSYVKGTIRAPGGKMIAFEGDVRHVLTPDPDFPERRFYGLEMRSAAGVSQRLIILTMEVQRRAVMGY